MLINILVVFACFFEDVTPKLNSGIISLLAGIVIISKMIYQFLEIPDLDLLCLAVSFANFLEQLIFIVTFCETNMYELPFPE